MFNVSLKILVMMFLLAINSCLSRVVEHGYQFENVDYVYLEPNLTSKSKAYEIMGSPTFTSFLGEEEIWFYYSGDIDNMLFFKPKIVKRQIVELNFDNSETLTQINRYNLKDEREFAFSPDITIVKTKEKGFFKELFGNVGRVTPQ